jgi:phosphate transport system substrate-binding protein
MNNLRKRLGTICVLLTAGIWLNGQHTNEPQAKMVEWLSPAAEPNHPQTPQDEERGRQMGRSEPAPEILQPSLDSALPSYQARKDVRISGEFKAACSDVLVRLVRLWIGGFQRYYPNVKIDVPPPYAGSLGAKELVKGTLDFVFVSRELRPDDITDFKEKFGYAPLSVAISGGSYRHFGFLDAIGFFVNKENPIENISFAQLDAILSGTHHRGGQAITQWGQLGLPGEWASKPIHVYGIKPWNGFEEFIRQRVLSVNGQRGEWRDDINFDKVVFPVARRVEGDRYGIGYSGLAYIDAGVKVLPLSPGKSGPFYAPSYENVARAVYPLSRVLYFNINKTPGKPLNPAISEFLRFVLSREGQQIVLDEALFLPLRASQVEASRGLLEN